MAVYKQKGSKRWWYKFNWNGELILTHYEQFDSRYKGVLPLKRVYVPDPDGTTGEEQS